MIGTVTICGVGLIGGSYALALRKAGFAGRILGVSSARTLEAARQGGVIDEGVTLEEGIPRADLIYLAQPISRILQLLPAVAALRAPHALVTDAGSTKSVIMRRALELIPGDYVLGGHPMAGKETRGVEAASADLFQGRTYVLTPGSAQTMESPIAREFAGLLEKIGCGVILLDADTHDRAVAFTSHLAQLASTSLATTVANALGKPELVQTAGPALREMTRVAMSSYDLWRDILATNQAEVLHALDQYIATLQNIRGAVSQGEAESYFAKGEFLARRLRGDLPNSSK
ncbi:MAG: prephenate dehydrogenase/arogenate dehydrogenase family protein [Candidatus Solibacter usitatus]|nr:prephenate dehydrogenase/arogenate dehydrogenase family protein [Candidatus Solibacter usitatus]